MNIIFYIRTFVEGINGILGRLIRHWKRVIKDEEKSRKMLDNTHTK